MDEVAVLVGFHGSCAEHCMYGRGNTGTDKTCSRPIHCAVSFDYVYMRPATALHFKLTGEVDHVLDHNPQTTDTSIVR